MMMIGGAATMPAMKQPGLYFPSFNELSSHSKPDNYLKVLSVYVFVAVFIFPYIYFPWMTG